MQWDPSVPPGGTGLAACGRLASPLAERPRAAKPAGNISGQQGITSGTSSQIFFNPWLKFRDSTPSVPLACGGEATPSGSPLGP